MTEPELSPLAEATPTQDRAQWTSLLYALHWSVRRVRNTVGADWSGRLGLRTYVRYEIEEFEIGNGAGEMLYPYWQYSNQYL